MPVYARQGLPTDDLSVQNGILVTRATRFPVLVDPQGQGRAWLRQREAAAQLRTIGLSDKTFRAALEACPCPEAAGWGPWSGSMSCHCIYAPRRVEQ